MHEVTTYWNTEFERSWRFWCCFCIPGSSPFSYWLWLSHCILHVAVTLSGSAVMTTSLGTGQTQIQVPGLAVSSLLSFLFPMNENGIVKSLFHGMKSLTKMDACYHPLKHTCAPVCDRDTLITQSMTHPQVNGAWTSLCFTQQTGTWQAQYSCFLRSTACSQSGPRKYHIPYPVTMNLFQQTAPQGCITGKMHSIREQVWVLRLFWNILPQCDRGRYSKR